MITPLPESCQCLSGCECFSSGTHMAHTIALLWSTVSPETGKHCLEGLHCFIFTFQSCDTSYEWKKKRPFQTSKLKQPHLRWKVQKLDQNILPASWKVGHASASAFWVRLYCDCGFHCLACLSIPDSEYRNKRITRNQLLQESTHLHEATFWCPEIGNGEVTFDEGGYRRQEHLLELAHE